MTPLGRRALLAAIGGAWLGSLALPAVELSSGAVYGGAELLLRGWQGIRAGVVAWCANPLFVAALAAGALERLRAAAIMSGLALALGLTSFVAEATARARGVPVPPLAFRSGFYLWLAAFGALFACTFLAARHERSDHGAAGGIER